PGLTSDQLYNTVKTDILNKVRGGAVDYPTVKKLKLDLLRMAFKNFAQQDQGSMGSYQRSEFETFKKQQQSWLPHYSLFRTLVDVNGGNACWPQWPEAQRLPDSAEQWLNKQPNAKQLKEDREFYCYVQWVASRQWLDVR